MLFSKLIAKLYLKQPNNLAYFDQACGCYNRNYFELELKNKLLSGYSITVIDINEFKVLNDTFGHQAGDAALKHLADKAIELSHSALDFVVRYGGDEFVIVSHETKGQFKADTLAQELQSQYSISISYGTVQLKRNESLQSAVDRADKEMYAMKRMYYTTKAKQL